MRPLLKTLSILSVSPVWQCSACRNAPLFTQQLQCLPNDAPLGYPSISSKRSLSTSSPSSSQSAPLSNSSFSYHVGASFSAKGRRFNPKEDTFSFDPTYEKDVYTGRPNSGQDAFFVSNTGPVGSNGKRRKMAFGVADGVGGWADSGIDSADFSHGLCHGMARVAKDDLTSDRGNDPQGLLARAYKDIVREREIEGGGSTACVAVGDEDGSLSVANLGDSGFIHLRLNAVNYFSNPQTHAFNTPFQLSIVPPKILALSKIFGGKQLSDSPRDSNNSDLRVRHGDVVIFATDGVWDNLSTVDILKIVSRQMLGFGAWSTGDNGIIVNEHLDDLTKEGGVPKQNVENSLQTLVAVNVVGEAKRASENLKRDGPFAKEVQKYYPNEDYHGGKVDDICVVVAIVVKRGIGGEK